MPLTPPVPGLHRLRNNSKQTAKAEVRVAPGEELEVSAGLAAQLQAASGSFQPVDGLAPFPDLTSIEPDEDTKPAVKRKKAAKAKPDG